MRHNSKFNELLIKYEGASLASGIRPDLFQKMRKKAKTFSDWASIYQYAGDEIRYEALEKMRKTVLKGETTADIQLNIIELFLVIDTSERDEILEKYLKKHHRKDDLLFTRTQCDWMNSDLGDYLWCELNKHYKSPGYINVGIKFREKRNHTLVEKFSTFNPWYYWLLKWVGEISLSTHFLYLSQSNNFHHKN